MNDNEARSGAAQVVAQIGVIELCHGKWENLAAQLMGNMEQGTPVVKEGTLKTLGILCEEIVRNTIPLCAHICSDVVNLAR